MTNSARPGKDLLFTKASLVSFNSHLLVLFQKSESVSARVDVSSKNAQKYGFFMIETVNKIYKSYVLLKIL